MVSESVSTFPVSVYTKYMINAFLPVRFCLFHLADCGAFQAWCRSLECWTSNTDLSFETEANKLTWGISRVGHQGVIPWRGKGIVERGRGIFFHHGVLLYYSLPWAWAGQQPVVCAVFTRRHLWGRGGRSHIRSPAILY